MNATQHDSLDDEEEDDDNLASSMVLQTSVILY